MTSRRDRDGEPLDGRLPHEVFQSPSRTGSASDAPRAGDAVIDPDLPELGTVLDKYRIEEVVGAGGFAVVFRARHLLLDMPVAIKILRPRVIRRWPALATALCEEARLAARIAHPSVVRVFDVTHTDAVTFIVMELLEGESLGDLLRRRGPLRPVRALRIGMAVASGLRAGLAERVIHRDIKPANIVLTRGGHPKIVDLGLARSPADPRSAIRSRPGIVGTPGYMAPEQAIDPDRVDFRADLYALGATLYHAVVGQPPFPTDDPARAIELHARGDIVPPGLRVAGLPPGVDELLMAMLARDPRRRPSSYDALLAAMRRLVDELEPAPPR